MITNITRAQYMREYKNKNREKLTKYKKLWTRKARKKQREAKKTWIEKFMCKYPNSKFENLVPQRKPPIKSTKCQRCEILLLSDLAKGGNEKYCRDCLNEQENLQH